MSEMAGASPPKDQDIFGNELGLTGTLGRPSVVARVCGVRMWVQVPGAMPM